jgi:UDP-glucose 4-epimerase
MKALVTGGAGFIGSHLVEELIYKGHEVVVLDNMVSGCLDFLHPKVNFQKVDICSNESREVIKKEKPDIIFHLAAQADVGHSIDEPQIDAEVNIKGTLNVLEACTEAKVKKLIFASTSAVYGNLQKDKISEEDIATPISYYGLSKYTAEAYIRIFSQIHSLPYTILRYGNVYGPRQTAKGEGGVVAVFLDYLKNGLRLNIHGDGEQTRDFIYVKDVVQANMAAINNGNYATIHVSTSQKTSINELVKFLEKIHNGKVELRHTQGRKGDIKHSCLDNKKALDLLKWEPKTEIYKGLEETYTFKIGKSLS